MAGLSNAPSSPLWISLLWLSISSAVAGDELAAEVYMADVHHASWEFRGSQILCELTHEIPQFGLARFQRLAGDELSFRLDSYQPVPERIDGVLREVSPAWNHAPPDQLEHLMVVEAGMRPIHLDRRPTGWLLSALAKGMIGSFDMLDWNDSRKTRQIQLSPVNFQQPYRAFKQCLRELSGDGFSGLRESTVHFALDVDQLNIASRGVLRSLADFIMADARITAVRVTGHADDQGTNRYNLRLSARRASRVVDYLAELGVKQALLSRRHFGESRPKVRGRTEAARSANRRVEIELVR
jgi:outer membrane protein OmpA-like peptidoglycan-associated protein